MRKFIFLWPTIYPEKMIETYNHWIETSSQQYKILTIIAVNTKEHAKILSNYGFDKIYVVGEKYLGPVWPTFVLTQKLPQLNNNDIIILVSDDFYSPQNWDISLINEFDEFDGGLIVRDGISTGDCATIPILTFNCLKRLNFIIYHPIYHWQFSDVEFTDNLRESNTLKKSELVFEHQHWASGKRKMTDHDKNTLNTYWDDHKTYYTRKEISLEERLKIDQKYLDNLNQVYIYNPK